MNKRSTTADEYRKLYYTKSWKQLRGTILTRDGYRCQLCGVKTLPNHPPTSDRYPTLDHIVPLSRGGAHSRENTLLTLTGEILDDE